MSWVVTATSLNLRSEPDASSVRKAVLPNGQIVEKLEETDPSWWKVSASVGGAQFEGYVARKFLAEKGEAPAPKPASGIVAVHLAENKPTIKRDSAGGQAFPLGEPGRPTRTRNAPPAQKIAELHEIVKWLDVERKARYLRTASATFCNIYAYDYCYLADAYLPRVWWTSKAIADLSAGRSVSPAYGETLRELSANSLYNWLEDFGLSFGWTRVTDAGDLQDAANSGKVAIICAHHVNPNASGHIAAVVPEKPSLTAVRKNGEVFLPLQSQAGASNHRYFTGTSRWWAGSKLRAFGFWIHD